MASDDKIVNKLLEQAALPASSTKQKELEEEWRSRAANMTALNLKAIEGPMGELDVHLTLRSHIVGYQLTNADLVVWGTIRSNRVAHAYVKQGLMVSLTRWFNYIQDSNEWISATVAEAAAKTVAKGPDAKANAAAARGTNDEGGSYDIGLPDTEKGVVTRFPPEPSGFLHIGHAKAALLNDYFAHVKYTGTLILRFDDTNPSKESEIFQDSIKVDCKLMGIEPDLVSYSSDYFDRLYDYCIQMIKDGNAYADDTPQMEAREQRGNREPSARRDMKVEDSLARFEDMKSGSEAGQKWFIRAKIDYANFNGALRDPVIYRCNPAPHHRTGSTWKIYPTYDFTCPIVDSIEGVTHALRTTEYNDRDAQYQWMLKALNLRPVHNWNFARLNFVRTLLSKRKLTKLVDGGRVGSFDNPSDEDYGWKDPRMPTIRGIRRRGMTIDALREFILKQGPSKNVVNLDWFSFWATNKKYIDPIAGRYTAVTTSPSAVPVIVTGAHAAPYSEEKPLHAKNPDVGTKKVWYSADILIDQEDAQSFAQDEEITLMNWGNAIVRKISRSLNPLSSMPITSIEMELHLQGDVKKTAKKITWLSKDQDLVPVKMVDFDYLITKDKLEEEDNYEDFLTEKTEFVTEGMADCNVAKLKEDTIMQFDRKGFFRIDRPFKGGEPAVLFKIPIGKK